MYSLKIYILYIMLQMNGIHHYTTIFIIQTLNKNRSTNNNKNIMSIKLYKRTHLLTRNCIYNTLYTITSFT